jgi:KTSC domain
MEEKNYTTTESSTVRRVKYMPEESILEVEFTGGNIYHYYEVYQRTADALFAADKVGLFVNQNIKWKHQYKKIK